MTPRHFESIVHFCVIIIVGDRFFIFVAGIGRLLIRIFGLIVHHPKNGYVVADVVVYVELEEVKLRHVNVGERSNSNGRPDHHAIIKFVFFETPRSIKNG